MSKILNRINNLLVPLCLPLCLVLTSCEEDEGKISASEVTAAFAADATDVLAGQAVTFEDQSTGDVTHWSWIFEGGTPDKSNEQNPVVTYSEPGSFEVKLVVSNGKYTSPLTKTDYIVVTAAPQPVTADFTADKVSILSGESITFTDISQGNATEWEWEFIPESGTTLTASGQNPAVTFPDPGTYTVKLTVANSQYSDEEIKEAYITVIDATAVAADFSADTRLTYSGQAVAFTDLSVGTVTSWEWTFEGGTPATSTEQNPAVTYNTAGQYKVTLTATNDTRSSTKEEVGYITVIPGSGLLTFLPFSGSGEDMGPLGLDVVNVNETVTFDGTDRGNNPNAAAVFDGTGILSIPATEGKQLGTSSYSIGVWLKSENPQQMYLWQEGGADSPQTAYFRINFNSTTRIYSFLPNLGGIINVSVDDGASQLSDGAWHYVVCTRDAAGAAKVYVDGALIDERTLTIEDLTNDIGLTIGGEENGAEGITNYYNGQLDDLVIYNRALSEEEITLLSGF